MSRSANLLKVVLGIVLYGSSFAGLGASQSTLVNQSQYSKSERTTNTVFKYLGRALESTGKSVLVEYSGACAKYYGSYAVSFPPIKVRPPSKELKDLAAVREIFKKSKEVRITETRGGVIKISIGRVWISILGTNISRLALTDDEQYTPDLAIYAVLDTTEMRAAMVKLHAQNTLLLETLVSLSRKGQPHLPSIMENVTAAQVLESIAETFKGIVVYSECMQPDGKHLIDIGFAGRIADYSE